MPYSKRLQLFAGIFLFTGLSVLAFSIPGYTSDTGYFISWSSGIFKSGISNAYGMPENNYMPVFQYLFWLFGILSGSVEKIAQYFNYFRSLILLFDIAGLWMLYKWAGLKEDFILILCFNLLNIAFIYNTVIWGQVDSVGAVFIFAALYTGYRRQLLASGLLFLLAVNSKLQVGIFFPVWILLLLSGIRDKGAWKKTVLMLVAMGVLQGLILLPFFMSSGGLSTLRHTISGYFHFNPVASVYAYNLWYCLFTDAQFVSDELHGPLGLTYKLLGFLLFCCCSLIALFPLIKYTWRHLRDGSSADEIAFPKDQLWLITGIIALLFFFLNTEMHERYAHPAFIFITAYCFYRRQFLAYLLFSVAYFLNLEALLQYLKLPAYGTLLFNPRLVAGIYALLILYLFFLLYRKRRFLQTAATGRI